MSTDKRTGWECQFCFENLKPQPLIGWQRLLWLVPVRTFQCPHCFNTFRKPVAFIAAIPFVGSLFCKKRRMSGRISEMLSNPSLRGKKSRRNYVSAGWFVRFARWTDRMDSNAGEVLGKSVRTLLWPFHWFSKTFLGSSAKSQRSDRLKSRKRTHSSRS